MKNKQMSSDDLKVQVKKYRELYKLLTQWLKDHTDEHQTQRFYKAQKLRDRCFNRFHMSNWVLIYRAGVEPQPWHMD
jgi:predicted Abi (CAAX) family protease